MDNIKEVKLRKQLEGIILDMALFNSSVYATIGQRRTLDMTAMHELYDRVNKWKKEMQKMSEEIKEE